MTHASESSSMESRYQEILLSENMAKTFAPLSENIRRKDRRIRNFIGKIGEYIDFYQKNSHKKMRVF